MTTAIPTSANKDLGTGRFRKNRGNSARSIGGIVAAIVIWELLSLSGAVNKNALPSPPSTFAALIKNFGGLSKSLFGTLEAWVIGMLIATIAGVVIGTLVGRSPVADAASETVVRMMRPLPSLALIPIAILVAGLGLKMTVGLVSFAAFWPIFINTRAGVRQVDNRFLESGSALGLKGLELLFRVILPAAAPLVAGGIQIAISIALIVTISVELVGGTGGLGQFVLLAQQANALSEMFAGIIVGGFIGWLLNVLFMNIVDRVLPWRTQGEIN